MENSLRRSWLALLVAVGAFAAGLGQSRAGLAQIDLVSDIPGLATITDPELHNPWGVSESPTSPFWVSNQGTNTSTLYTVTNTTNVSKVNINPPSGFVGIPTTGPTGPQGPTGQVNNSNASTFLLAPATPARFIFADLNGTISAWAGGATSTIKVPATGAVYTGLAINTAQNRIYAANSAGVGSINVFDSSFNPVSLPGAFTVPNLPAGFVPFNIRDIGGKLYVAYAPGGRPNQTGATAGMGVVAIFDENGGFLQTLVSGTAASGNRLAAPWGMAIAPAGFGGFGGDLLVGNFSFVDSEINAFDPTTGSLVGTIPIDVGVGNTPGGLWNLTFGNGGSGGDPNNLYFADGINGEADGLFGVLIPEPSSMAVLGTAFVLIAVRRTRSKRRA